MKAGLRLIAVLFAVIVVVIMLMMGINENSGAVFGGLVGVLAAFLVGSFVYFIPSFVAHYKDHPKMMPIFVINLLLGWTVIGWRAAFIWAAGADTQRS